MKTIALTGATGFVGQPLLRLLAQNHHIKALTRRPQPPRQNVEWILGDFDNPSVLKTLTAECDIVIHCAGLIKARNAETFNHINAESVTALLNAINNPVPEAQLPTPTTPHFILISTMAAQVPGISSYGDSKRLGEEYLKRNAGTMPWTIIRPPAVYGPGDAETLKMFKPLQYGLKVLPAVKDQRAALIHVTDLTEAIAACMLSNSCYGKLLNVSDNNIDGYTLADIMTLAATLLGRHKTIEIRLPRWILKTIAVSNVFIARICGITPMLTPEKVREIYHASWVAEGDFVQDDTPWQSRYSLEQGLSETLQWYRQEKLL